MSVRVTFHCDGCDAKADGVRSLRREFVSLSGRGYGFGNYVYDNVIDVVPEGWIVYDIIGATYCPTCAKGLYPDAGGAADITTAQAPCQHLFQADYGLNDTSHRYCTKCGIAE